MSFHVLPLSVLTCHCNVGAGLPLASEIKDTVSSAHFVCDKGCVVTVGGLFDGVLQVMLTSLSRGVSAVFDVVKSALYWMYCEVPPIVAPLEGMAVHDKLNIVVLELDCLCDNCKVVPTGTSAVQEAVPQFFKTPAS